MDDRSTDNTSEQCAGLQLKLPPSALQRYQWHRRNDSATPGKSAVMNDALKLLDKDVYYVLILDADARLPENFFDEVLPIIETDSKIAALQVPKRISNVEADKLCLLQDVEYMLDAGVQVLRNERHFGVELRGNGMLLRPSTLSLVGGFSEHTLTDDLDMSTKLHASNQPIAFVSTTAVHEEGVVTSQALFKQRLRWALGSMRRYLDYAPALLKSNAFWGLKLESLAYGSNFSMPIAIAFDLLMILLIGKMLIFKLTLWVLSVFALFLVLFLSFIPPLCRPQYSFNQTLRLAAWGAAYMVWLWPRVVLLGVWQLLITPTDAAIKWEKTAHHGI
jgi:1,2-diacylglycerol 3-beta-glucosyltransferase